ncbi:MAG: hypothetical protein L6R38_007140 [Xanthoria sp. 2 TBL-2021]|nr:MAG: hypothetical protein L6R38_007140 [Xanthoria sp. 2 TBL-2021]
MPSTSRHIVGVRTNGSTTSPSHPQPHVPPQRRPRTFEAQSTPSSSAMPAIQAQSQAPLALSSSSAQPAIRRFPLIEPDSSPHLPGHFNAVEVCSSFDRTDPDYIIFESIQDQLNQIIMDVQPDLGSCCVKYGTIRREPGDDDFDSVLHPKVLAVEMCLQSIGRWEEVDSQIRSLVNHAYSMQSRRAPLIRYYLSGARSCYSDLTSLLCPPIEPNSSPYLPPHFSMVDVRSSDDITDPDYVIFMRIRDEIDQILDSVQPPFYAAFSEYGTISRYFDDDDYDPILHPKLILIGMDEEAIGRWAEVDLRIRSLVERTYESNGRRAPPIRYYIGGFMLC